MAQSLALVIPCFNEADRLNISSFQAFLTKDPKFRLVFVDDGSVDGTREILEQLRRAHEERVFVVTQAVNAGKAEAVRVGLTYALSTDAQVVGFWDADLATPLDAVWDLLGILECRPDIDWVLGARVQLLGREIRRRAVRHYLGRLFATAASVVLQMPVYDTQCGAKLFRSQSDLREVVARGFVSRWVFDVEMLARFARIRKRDGGRSALESIYEYPLQQWADVAGSKVRGRDFLRASVEFLQIWRDAGSEHTTAHDRGIALSTRQDAKDDVHR